MEEWAPTLISLVVLAVLLAFLVPMLSDIAGWTLSAALNVTSAMKPEAEKVTYQVGNYTAVYARPDDPTLRSIGDALAPIAATMGAVLATPLGLAILIAIGLILLAYEVRWRAE